MEHELVKRRRHDSSRRERIERTLLAMRARGLIGKPGVMVALARHFGVTRQHIWQIGVDAGILGKGARPSGPGAGGEEPPPDCADLGPRSGDLTGSTREPRRRVPAKREPAMARAVEAPTTKHEWVASSAGRLCIRCREFQKNGEFDDTLECPAQPRSSG